MEAQRNIARELESLAVPRNPTPETRPLLVGIEGAQGPLNFAPYRSFPDTEITNQIADYFLKEGFITGPEHVEYLDSDKLIYLFMDGRDLGQIAYQILGGSLLLRTTTEDHFRSALVVLRSAWRPAPSNKAGNSILKLIRNEPSDVFTKG